MKKMISVVLIICIMLSAVGCKSSEDELYALYSSTDNVVNVDIGEYILGQSAPLLTEERLCIIDSQELVEDPELDCNAAILIDLTENRFIQGQGIYDKVYPASLTKLLTAYLILKYGNLDDIVTIDADNCGITESGAQLIGFKKGDKISVENLLYCLLVYSGNDSGVALAKYLCGSEEAFCEKLNEEAKNLGCNGTNFTNPHGLHDKSHYTTVYDMYIILRACMNYETFRNISKVVDYEITYQDIEGKTVTKSFSTTNRFKLGKHKLPDGVTILGGKTGNTYAAGACLIQQISTASGKEYIVGVFGAQSVDLLYDQMYYLIDKVASIDMPVTPIVSPEGNLNE